MKSSRLFLITLLLVSLFVDGNVLAQIEINAPIKITTSVKADKVTADGGIVFLSSVDLANTTITSGGLEVSAKTIAGSVTAKEKAQVGIASILMQNTIVGGIPNAVHLEADVQDVMANEGARVDVATIAMNGTNISGDLTVNDKITARIGTTTAGENSTTAVASLIMNNATASSLTIDKLSADIDDLTVKDNANAYVSSLKLDGVTAGDVSFAANTTLGGPITVYEDEMLNVNSVVIENVAVSGKMIFNFISTIQNGIEVSGSESEVMVGGFRISSGIETGSGDGLSDSVSLDSGAFPGENVHTNEFIFSPFDIMNYYPDAAGSEALQNAMYALSNYLYENKGMVEDWNNGEKYSDELNAILKQLALAWGVDEVEIRKQFGLFLPKLLLNKGGIPEPIKKSHYGSLLQLRSGKIIGDNLGLNSVFGALLNPYTGLTGAGWGGKSIREIPDEGPLDVIVMSIAKDSGIPNAVAVKLLLESGTLVNNAISFHAITHDATGYLKENHGVGPGYRYNTLSPSNYYVNSLSQRSTKIIHQYIRKKLPDYMDGHISGALEFWMPVLIANEIKDEISDAKDYMSALMGG